MARRKAPRSSTARSLLVALWLVVVAAGAMYAGWHQATRGRPAVPGGTAALPPEPAPLEAPSGLPSEPAATEPQPLEATSGEPAGPSSGGRPSAPAPLEPPAAPQPVPPTPLAGAWEDGSRVAIVIDDCGSSYQANRGFIEYPGPLTLAVLPHLPFSRRVAAEARAAGKQVLLHLPMQNTSGLDPGPGTLKVDMPAEVLRRTLAEDLEAVPGIVGVNNHEGSLASADIRVMRAVLAELAGRGLFYLDSRTTAATAAPGLAAEMGVPLLYRDVFLDNQDDLPKILERLEELGEIARRRGQAVAIGHPRAETLRALQVGLPRLQERGIRLVPLGDLAPGRPQPALPRASSSQRAPG